MTDSKPRGGSAGDDDDGDARIDAQAADRGKPGSSFRCFLRVFTYNDGLGWLLNAVALVGMIGAGAALPLMEVVFGRFITIFNDFASGNMSPQSYRDQVSKYALYFVYLFLVKFLLTYIWTVLISLSAIRTTRRLRVDFVRQTLRQEVSFFDSAPSSSSIAGRMTTNGDLVSDGISEKLGVIVQAVSCFVAAFIVAFAVQWKLTLIIMCIVPVNIVVSVVCLAYDSAYEGQIFGILGASSSLAEEAFSTVRTAHAFWAFPVLSRRFDDILETARKVGRKKSLIFAIIFPAEFFCVFSGYGLAFWQGFRMYAEGEIAEPGTVVTVVFAVMVAAQALTQIIPHIIAVSKAAAAAQDLFSVIDRRPAIDSLSDHGERIVDFRGDIELRDLHFSYPSRPHVPVLSGLDLVIPANETTALVGASGSGKSTVFGLLERWYPFLAGSITLDGRPIESLNLQWLRTNIRLVQQEPTLFSGTIYQNVVDGLVGTDMVSLPDEEKRELVREACMAAFAHDFIQDLPNGYETRIGERGASLSGGQKQRIVIARSIISNPKVLLLDEATSALDPNAEKVVQKALNNVAKGRTMIVIAHRLSTIRDANNIVVMSKGRLVEQGSHQELIALAGAYSRLVQAQDLGGKAGSQADETDDEDDSNKNNKEEAVDLDIALTLTRSVDTTRREVSADNEMTGTDYGLLHGLYLILKEQRSLWGHMIVAVLACITTSATFPALAILFSETMKTFETMDGKKANFFALMFFVVALGNAVTYAMIGWLSNTIGQDVMKFYRSDVFNNTIRQGMPFFDKPENSTGALVSRLASEPTSLQELLSSNLLTMLISVASVVASCVLAVAYAWKLGLALSLGALPVLIGAGYLRVRLEYRLSADAASRFAESSGLATEAAMAIRTVSSLALERAVVERYDGALEGIARRAIGSLGWKMLFYALCQSVSLLAFALGFWYGGRLVSTGEYSTAQFYTAFVATIFSGESAAVFFQYTTSIAKARTAINYIFGLREDTSLLLDNDDETEIESDDGDRKGGGTDLLVDGVSFAYPLRPSVKVLRNINLAVGAGRVVALVGASGCGKSTVVSLLERFYDATRGTITSDGRDVRTYDRRRYRRSIALVQQEPALYQGSIRDNIALGAEAPDEQAVIEACEQANIWTFISSLPDGLSTACGTQGLSLSGGQRQRIAIARALIRKPRLLLLDEATSALDTESEKVVKEALDRAAGAAGRTTVAIAHRLSTIRDADCIAVFARGKIVELGTHEELVAKKGVYYDMVLGQSLDREA